MSAKYFRGMSRHYNVNDAGDIYFEPAASVNGALRIIKEYWLTSRREAAGYKPKVLIQSIDNHHSASKIREIIANHFELL
jgi:hypothetical protein